MTGKPFPREFGTLAISKFFINHVQIASLGGEISHVLRVVVSWYRGPIGVARGGCQAKLSARTRASVEKGERTRGF
jgi:hypothetical protein